MAIVQIYSSPYITVDYHPDDQLIFHTIHKPIGEEQLSMAKEAFNAGTKALEEYGLSKWLSDDRKNGPNPQELLDWAYTDWNPRTINAGWKYWANVVPVEIHAAGALMPLIEDLYKFGLKMRVFVNVEDALDWLKTAE